MNVGRVPDTSDDDDHDDDDDDDPLLSNFIIFGKFLPTLSTLDLLASF